MNLLKLKASPEDIEARIIAECPESQEIVNRALNAGLEAGWKPRRSLSREQAFAMYALAAPYNNSRTRILEIGTAYGFSARILAEACPLAHITTLNPAANEVQEARKHLALFPNVEVVTQKSTDYLKHYIGTGYDLIFVDGDHNQIDQDLQWWEWLRPGGLMIFHDYSPAGSWRECQSVYESLNRFAEKRGLHEPEVVIRDLDDVGIAGFYKHGDADKTLVNPYHTILDARSYSILGLRQLWTLFDLAQVVRDIPGDVMECGVANGGSAYTIWKGADKNELPTFSRYLYCFGDPDGVPEPMLMDGDKAMHRYRKYNGRWGASDDRLFYGLMTDRVPQRELHYLPGVFADTFFREDIEAKLAFLHIDATLYQSTYDSLEKWLPLVVSGGVVAISAYHYWPGIKLAAERYFERYGLNPGLFSYDDVNVAWRVE